MHRQVGSRETMRGQLEHLLEISGPSVSVQVLPLSCVRIGLLAGFAIATAEDRSEVAYFETAVHGITTGDPSEVAEAARLFDAIRMEALPVSMSAALIERTAEQRWT
nr:DUF5753 domain-containing protein [Planomonospora venezuelensis]